MDKILNETWIVESYRNFNLIDFHGEINKIKSKLDGQVLMLAKTGILHVEAALNSSNQEVKNRELILAHQEFVKLINLNPNEHTNTIDNKELICLGYWGSFLYFSFNKDKNNALIFMYECLSKYPLIGIKYFDSKFLNFDYNKKFDYLSKMIETNNEKEKSLPFYIRHSEDAQVLAKGAAITTFVGGAIVLSSMFKNKGIKYAAVNAAKTLEKTIEVKVPNEIIDIRNTIKSYEEERRKYVEKLCEECNDKLKTIKKFIVTGETKSVNQYFNSL